MRTAEEFRLIQGTPVEVHRLPTSGREVMVKREDLCCPYPGPTFSKIRGVYAHIRARPESLIGVLDTYHSKAGWAVAAVSRALGKHCVDYWPQYKTDGPALRRQQAEATEWGAQLRALPAGRSAVLYHQARRETIALGGYMMPNALKLPESVRETSQEFRSTAWPASLDGGTLVVSASSGTILAGVLNGLAFTTSRPSLIAVHMGYSRSQSAMLEYLREASRLTFAYWERFVVPRLRFYDEQYAYKDAARPGADAPFPCNPYYDLKAWRWLDRVACHTLNDPLVFWNIGD